ncbi:OmpP1/FadL family transporter [Botryobacter ruber]|uniref:OmpP1/FadL family transporter n=1 Tax=Botryobacter ruber TaxID=2171629 RepID=UPI000FEC645D|nr:hypothetical protein [Botryobacter ruber]
MINKIVSASLALVLGWSGTAFAQTEADALRYSRLGLSGSARIQGIGGANTALGADISNLSTNPAGLGFFRRSEVTISAGFSTANVQTDIANREGSYFGPSTTDSRNSLNIPQVGIVLSDRRGDEEGSDWRGTSFGLSINRLNNFNSRTTYRGMTGGSVNDWTIVDYFAELANNNANVVGGQTRVLDQLNDEYDNASSLGGYATLQGMAYGAFLIDVFEDEQGEFAAPLNKIGRVDFEEEVLRSGSQKQFDFGAGTNYRDKLYLGAAIGITSSNFKQERIYRESFTHQVTNDDGSTSNVTTDLSLRDEINSRGGGINLKVGTIYRFSDAFRAGLSIQTPTLYTFDENYDTFLHTTHSDIGDQSVAQMPGQFSYTLVTPFRATGGLAYFISKNGFLTADVEYVNYSNARFSERDSDFGSSGSFFSNLNDGVANSYQSAVNLRLGAEARYEVFRFRAGYARTGDPYKSSSLNGTVNTFTLGTGIRLQNFYLDAAYSRSNSDNRYVPYSFNEGPSPEVAITDRLTNIMFTAGFNF